MTDELHRTDGANDHWPLPSNNLPGRSSDAGQWLHPSSLLFEYAAGIRNQLIPALLALFSASTGSWVGGFIALLFFAGWMVMVGLRYLRLRYRLSGDDLIVDEGVVFHVHRTIPVQRIQNIDLVQNIFHRLFGVAEVRFETASGTEPEAVLRVLSLAEVESLRARIFARKQRYELSRAASRAATRAATAEPGTTGPGTTGPGTTAIELTEHATGEPPRVVPAIDGETPSHDGEQAEPRETLIQLSIGQLVSAGIASNRGTVLLLVGLGIISQQTSSASRFWDIDPEAVTGYLSESMSAIAGAALVVFGLLVLMLLIKTLSVAWYVLKFYGYTLDRSGNDLRVNCGLLTRVSATVRCDRIQLISIHRTLVGRRLGIASIRIETAGGGSESDDPATAMARRWFMPVISEAQIPAIMEQLRPGLKWDERSFPWQALSRRAAWRTRRVIVVLTALPALLTALLDVALIAVGLVLFGAFAWWWAGRRAAATRYARSSGNVLFRSGVFTRKCSLAFIDKIQSVTVEHSPFDRRWKMATLSVDTIASGPAEHRIAVPMLDIAFAKSERDSLCRAASLAG